MNLIDIRQVLTQILGFLLMLWILRRFAWGPVLHMLEARRQKIAGEFQEADRRKAEADGLKAKYEQDLRGIESGGACASRTASPRASGSRARSTHRPRRTRWNALRGREDEIAREREKAKELLKEQVIRLSMRSAEKILRQKLDDAVAAEAR